MEAFNNIIYKSITRFDLWQVNYFLINSKPHVIYFINF